MKKIILSITLITVLLSCTKQNEWLEVKSNKSDVIPATLEDFQALLDNTSVMNDNYPAIGMISSDNTYILDGPASTGGQLIERNAYKWAVDIYEGDATNGSDWQYPYKVIEYANVVLMGLSNSKVLANTFSNDIKGQALFFRAFAYYHLVQIYAKQYSSASAETDLGVPLKLEPDINPFLARATLQEVYNQIIKDLTLSESLLQMTPLYKTRPCKSTAQAMLSKTYLNMGYYKEALKYADLVLKSNDKLIDFNTLDKSLPYPFPPFQGNNNPEILFYSTTVNYWFTDMIYLLATDQLYDLYEADDLRKAMFFRVNSNGTYSFKGRYTGGRTSFCGITTNEVYLIRAEALARLGDFSSAMDILNKLLHERWKRNNGISSYTDQYASNAEEALSIILTERRKELPFSGNLRWEDLKRMNLDSRFAKTVSRSINGQQYTLPPNDNRYVYPIPPIETILNTKIINNPR